MATIYLVADAGYEHFTILGGFTDPGEAARYRDEVAGASEDQVIIQKLVLDQPRRALPGAWTATLWLDGGAGDERPTLYTSPDGRLARGAWVIRARQDGERTPIAVEGIGRTRYEARHRARALLARLVARGCITPARLVAMHAYLAEADHGRTYDERKRRQFARYRRDQWQAAQAEAAATGERPARVRRRRRANPAALARRLRGTDVAP